MTERKVINKYFPPDYDPSKIPRLKRGNKSRQFNIRTMAPFNMRCQTCNGYIYKAKKFNSRMETAEGVQYLGLRHYRFYIRCPICCAEIIWRTDLEANDYVIESGAKRNFEALKTAEELEAKKAALEEEELANNPMKLLEKRTDQSKNEMETAEALDDLKELNKRQAIMDPTTFLLRDLWQEKEAEKNAEEQADEDLIKKLLAEKTKGLTHFKKTDCKEINVPSSSGPPLEYVRPFEPQVPRKLTAFQTTAKKTSGSHRDLLKKVIIKKRPAAAQSNIVDVVKKLKPDEIDFTSQSLCSGLKPQKKEEGKEVEQKQSVNCLGLVYSDDSSEND